MREHNPKVSIVIPVYNGSNYLKEAIDSALAQTYKNIEIIVINDGSTDNGATEKIAKSYGNKIKYYKKENGGVATALNFGIEKMTGEYFSWLSHDDMYTKMKVEVQIEALQQLKGQNTIIASNVIVLFENGLKKKEWIHESTFRYIDIFLATSAIVGLNGCSLLIPKKAFYECGKFDQTQTVTQDYDLWFRMKDFYDFVLLNNHLVVSRRHELQDSVQKNEQMVREADKLHAKFLEMIHFSRFDHYFSRDSKNLVHSTRNYRSYKLRGYNKTASKLLLYILNYLYKYDQKSFYKMYVAEVSSLASDAAQNYKLGLNKVQANNIATEFNEYFKHDSGNFHIRYRSRDETVGKQATYIRKLSNYLKSDGAVFTIKRVAYKLLAKIKLG